MRNRPSNMLFREIETLRQTLRVLDGSLLGLAPMIAAAAKANGAEPEIPRRRVRLSAKSRASLVLQGRYMGYMRQLKSKQKAQVRRIKEANGVRAAIAKARTLAAH